jgi:hypothetical protein
MLTAKFSLYAPDEVQVFFGVEVENADELLPTLLQLRSNLDRQGFLPVHPSLRPQERIEAVDAWVLGRTKKREDGSGGQPAVYLYSSHAKMQYRVATVWEEQIESLPFAPDILAEIDRGKFWLGAAPERDTAKVEGVLHLLPAPVHIVLAPTGKKSDKGNPLYRFARIQHAPQGNKASPTPAPGPAPTPVPPSETTPQQSPDIEQALTSSKAMAAYLVEQGKFTQIEAAHAWMEDLWTDRPAYLRKANLPPARFLSYVLNEISHEAHLSEAPF